MPIDFHQEARYQEQLRKHGKTWHFEYENGQLESVRFLDGRTRVLGGEISLESYMCRKGIISAACGSLRIT